MSDSSSYDRPRSHHHGEDPNALQRIPSTNSAEVKDLWKDVNDARRNDPFLPRIDNRVPAGLYPGDSQERLLQHVSPGWQTRTHSRPSSGAAHDLTRSDSDETGGLGRSWNTAERRGYTNTTTARYRDEPRDHPVPGPPVKTGESSRAFIPVAKHRIKDAARKVLQPVSNALGSSEEHRMAKRQQRYKTKERRAEYERDAQRREAYLTGPDHLRHSWDMDSD